MIGELWRFRDRGQIEDMPEVRVAVAAIKPPVVGIQVARAGTRTGAVGVRVIARAVRQRVIPYEGDSPAGAPVNRK